MGDWDTGIFDCFSDIKIRKYCFRRKDNERKSSLSTDGVANIFLEPKKMR
jgi:hypothetical protein